MRVALVPLAQATSVRVCRLFRSTRYGSPSNAPDRQLRSRQGKVEKSFLAFALAYPSWEPPEIGKKVLGALGLGWNRGIVQRRPLPPDFPSALPPVPVGAAPGSYPLASTAATLSVAAGAWSTSVAAASPGGQDLHWGLQLDPSDYAVAVPLDAESLRLQAAGLGAQASSGHGYHTQGPSAAVAPHYPAGHMHATGHRDSSAHYQPPSLKEAEEDPYTDGPPDLD